MELIKDNFMVILIIFIVSVSPVFTYLDSLYLTFYGLSNQLLTPKFWMYIKELLLLLLFFSGLKHMKVLKYMCYDKTICFMGLLFFFSIGVSFFSQEYIIILYGFKWLLPLLLIVSFFSLTSNDYKILHNKLIYILLILFYINFFLQCIQIFTLIGSPFSPNSLGLSQRTMGVFRSVNALAFFDVMTVYFVYSYMKSSLHKNVILFFLLPLSLFFVGSVTPFVSLMLFVFVLVIKKMKIKTLYILYIIIFITVFSLFPLLLGRMDIFNSVTTRLDIIINAIHINTLFISNNFGIGTNLAAYMNKGIITDSTPASMILNVGFLATMLFYAWIVKLLYHSKRQGIYFGVLVLPMTLTNVVFESFPVNILFSLEIAYFLHINLMTKA